MIKETNALLDSDSILALQRAELNLIHLRKILPMGQKALKTRKQIETLRVTQNLTKRQERKLKLLEFRLIDCLARFHEDNTFS